MTLIQTPLGTFTPCYLPSQFTDFFWVLGFFSRITCRDKMFKMKIIPLKSSIFFTL